MNLIEALTRRAPRERLMLGVTALVAAVMACYTAAVGPARQAKADAEVELATSRSGLDLQQRQLALLRAETALCRRMLAGLADEECPWVEESEVGGVIRSWQQGATEVGLALRSIGRERTSPVRRDGEDLGASLLVLRIEAHGSYPALMAFLGRLSEGERALGLEELFIQVDSDPPFDVEVLMLVRVCVASKEKEREKGLEKEKGDA